MQIISNFAKIYDLFFQLYDFILICSVIPFWNMVLTKTQKETLLRCSKMREDLYKTGCNENSFSCFPGERRGGRPASDGF